MTATILIVDDERDIVDLLAYNLGNEGYSTLKAYDGETAIQATRCELPALIILDLMLPGIQGMEVCRRLRNDAATKDIPIIMLTAKGDEVDKILGLEMGADDYITKPFSVRELLARVRSVLRRSAPREESAEEETFSFEGLTIDYRRHAVIIDDRPIELSPMEFRLLKFLAHHPGRVYTRDQLLDHVWGDEAFVDPRTVDVHIRRLRSRIENDAARPRYIFTVRGFGYKFADIV